MASKGSPTKEPVSQRDLEILLAAFLSFKAPPQIDYDELAKNAGFKNAKTASTMWSTLKKKYAIGMNASGSAEGGSPSTLKAATPRKRKSAAAAASSSANDGSPAKKAKTPSSKLLADHVEEEEDDDQNGGVKLEGAPKKKDEDEDEKYALV